MENCKKKNLKFMGFSREKRKQERESQRCVSRHQRFSIIRPLDDEGISEEKKENSRIPTIGKPKDQASSRVEMLAKWKQEKMVRKQKESCLRKPVFKVGVMKSDPSPSLGSKPLFALDSSSRLFKSSFHISNTQLSSKRQESYSANTTTITKDKKIPSCISQKAVIPKPEPKWTRNKESGIKPQVDAASKFGNKESGIKPKVDTSKFGIKDQLTGSRKQPTAGSLPHVEPKKIESRLPPLNGKPKVTSVARDVKKNIPSSVPKPSVSRTLSKGLNQIPSSGLPKPSASRTLSVGKEQTVPRRNEVKSIPKFSKTAATQQKGNIQEKTAKHVPVPTKKPDTECLMKKPGNVELSGLDECEISHIEPVKDQRKSFAPQGFKFQPPIELNSSLFLEDGPSAIFMRMKNQFLRTSTPKQSSSETKGSKCLEIEDINLSMEEKNNSQCPKNTDNKLDTPHKYNLESFNSSFSKSVDLNDVKPVDCKQHLQFPEVISIEKQEVVLESKGNENCLVVESPPDEVFNPTTLSDSVKNNKDKINSTDTSPIDVGMPETVVTTEPVDLTRDLMDGRIPPLAPVHETVVTTQPDDLTSDPIDDRMPFLAPLPKTVITDPVDDLNKDPMDGSKALIDFTDASLIDDSKIAVPIPEVAGSSRAIGATSRMEQNKNLEKNQNLLDGFLQNKENGLKMPGKKFRSLRQSEKPGLSSITESLEDTPKSAMKKKVLDSIFTPRRSLRLAKFSNYSLENLVDDSKLKEDKDKASSKQCFTPRRSSRLSKLSTEFNSLENLFDVGRPTLFGTPEKDEAVKKLSTRVTYDFDRLSLETDEEVRPRAARGGKVSLLYTPPNRARQSVLRKSVKGDLMSFSPNM